MEEDGNAKLARWLSGHAEPREVAAMQPVVAARDLVAAAVAWAFTDPTDRVGMALLDAVIARLGT